MWQALTRAHRVYSAVISQLKKIKAHKEKNHLFDLVMGVWRNNAGVILPTRRAKHEEQKVEDNGAEWYNEFESLITLGTTETMLEPPTSIHLGLGDNKIFVIRLSCNNKIP